jgi:hypothetical protein
VVAAGVQIVRDEVAGEKVFADFMKEAVDRYKSTVKNLDDKQAFYKNLAPSYQAFVAARQKSGAKFSPLAPKLDTWNNAALLAYSNYYSDYSVLERMLRKCDGNLGRFVAWISAVQAKGEKGFEEAPESFLAKLESASGCP